MTNIEVTTDQTLTRDEALSIATDYAMRAHRNVVGGNSVYMTEAIALNVKMADTFTALAAAMPSAPKPHPNTWICGEVHCDTCNARDNRPAE